MLSTKTELPSLLPPPREGGFVLGLSVRLSVCLSVCLSARLLTNYEWIMLNFLKGMTCLTSADAQRLSDYI